MRCILFILHNLALLIVIVNFCQQIWMKIQNIIPTKYRFWIQFCNNAQLCYVKKTTKFLNFCFHLSGYCIYRVRVRRGGRKRPVPKGATYGKPTNQGVNQLKFQRSLQSVAEVGYFKLEWKQLFALQPVAYIRLQRGTSQDFSSMHCI